MWPEDDYMEIGESGFAPSVEGGFIEIATGKFISYDELIFKEPGLVQYIEDGELVQYLEDEDYNRDLDDEIF